MNLWNLMLSNHNHSPSDVVPNPDCCSDSDALCTNCERMVTSGNTLDLPSTQPRPSKRRQSRKLYHDKNVLDLPSTERRVTKRGKFVQNEDDEDVLYLPSTMRD